MASSTATIDLITVGQAGKEVTANDLFWSVSPALLFARRAAQTSGLTWAFYGGRYNGVDVANGTVTLTTNATNYVEADTTTGAVTKNTVGFSATGTLPLYVVTVNAGGDVSSYADRRQAIGSGGGSATLPNGLGAGAHTYGASTYSLIAGGNNNTVAAGSDRVTVSGGVNNSVASTGNTIGGGYGNTISSNATYSFIGGGYSNSISPTVASTGTMVILGGSSNTVKALNAVVIGGANNLADGMYSVAWGGRGTARGIYGANVVGAPMLSSTVGATQRGIYTVGYQTADATQAILTADGTQNLTSLNQLALPTAAASYAVTGIVVAKNTATGDSAMFEVKALVKWSGAALSFVGAPTVTQLFADASASGWAVAVIASTPYRAIQLAVTGAAATTIRWLGTLQTVELMSA